MTDSLDQLRDALRTFAQEREWAQFHSPKNLAMALAVEAGELMEPLQWLAADDIEPVTPELRQRLQEEAADVLIYLVLFADRVGFDLLAAARQKLAANAARYPTALARGSARKAPGAMHDE